MSSEAKIATTRFLIASIIYLLVSTIVFKLALSISNHSRTIPDDDLHGYVQTLFNVFQPLFVAYLGTYWATGRFDLRISSLNRQRVEQVYIHPEPRQDNFGMEKITIITILSITWTIIAIWNQFLFMGVADAAKDPIIDLGMTDISVEKLQSTIRGTIYLASFFPAIIGSAFLCGFLAKQKLSYRAMIQPAFCVYGVLNFLAVLAGHKPSAVQAVEHFVRAAQSNPGTLPPGFGFQFFIWGASIFAFAVVCVVIAFLGFIFALLGQSLHKRYFKRYIA